MTDRDHAHQPDPYRPTVRGIRASTESVEFSAYSCEAVLTTCAEWVSAQRQISTEWTVVDTGWNFRCDDHGMRYTMTLHLDRTGSDGVLPDGSRPSLVDRLPWPPADRY